MVRYRGSYDEDVPGSSLGERDTNFVSAVA